MQAARLYQLYGTLIAVLGVCALIAISMGLADGKLFYALDDPYIHLAVAEQILAGGYGVNAGELASPSSSILYPFLLVPLEALGLGQQGPILLGLAAAGATAWLASGTVWHFVERPRSAGSTVLLYLLLPLILLSVNLYALPLLGMEHSLHVLAVVAVMCGLLRLEKGKRVPLLLTAGVILGPLLRFESYALSLAVVLVLPFWGKWRTALLYLFFIVAPLGIYAYSMSRLGLPLLPSSVMTKSGVSASLVSGTLADDLKVRLVQWMKTMERAEARVMVFAAAMCILALAFQERVTRRAYTVAFVAVSALGAHVLVGDYGWWSRYEVYAVAIALVALAALWGPVLRGATLNTVFLTLGLATILGNMSIRYAYTTARTPMAAQNIYLQQHQMHRFATEFFPYPVAVNDLGQTSYHNPNYVLDLWGLGSEEARARRARGLKREDVRELAEARDVAYAMVYRAWLGHALPKDWCQAGVLTTPKVSAAFGEVLFVLVKPELEAEFFDALTRFEETLPDGARLETHPCQASAG